MIARLALEDGTVFAGTACGAAGTRTGEVVFNTAMTGYQEVFTDPSYCGQIVTMTFPLQGNYGVNADDFESAKLHLSGVVVKELPRQPSNYRATASFRDFLERHGIIGLAGIDTRALTRRIRVQGALRGVISTEDLSDVELVQRAQAAPPMAGANLVEQVAPHKSSPWSQSLAAEAPPANAAVSSRCHIVAIDCGIKHNILRHLVTAGARITTAPAGATADQIRELAPQALVVGNGPGDPAAVEGTAATLRQLLGTLPILGVCLGHQLLAIALGATTYKLRFGHHGANLPVHNRASGRVEITSQNHGFAVDTASLERVGGSITHVNLNDDSLEGFLHRDQRALAVQFHPEASPGPHDASYVFRRFAAAVADGRPIDLDLLA